MMEDFGKANERFFRRFLELPHGIPDKKTCARVCSWIEPGALLGGLQTWLMGVNNASGRAIPIDGKTIQRSEENVPGCLQRRFPLPRIVRPS
ncbi:MAG: hypothetical protein LBF63_07445 [Treponema sp.]|nr:hypothetical protein [Treponema sp.]